MRKLFNIFILVFIGISACLSFSTCSTIPNKSNPEYDGVDPAFVSLVNEYKYLAKTQGITFKKEVTIGFKRIKIGRIIGITYYGSGWREIDIDEEFWSNATETTKMALLWHENSHAYCSRDHDYGKGMKYPDADEINRSGKITKNKTNGYFDDECPLSIMYPLVLDDYCTLTHYFEYTTEIFQRCEPF